MFDLKILGIAKAKSLIGQDWPTHIISVINDAGPNWPATHIDRQHGNHAIYNFHDVENDDPEEYGDLVAPTLDTMRDIIDTLRSWDLDDQSRVLIHCSAGKSRSTAIALALLALQGQSPVDALAKIKLLSPAMCPNRLMVGYFDTLLGRQGELIGALEAWYDDVIIRVPGLALPNRGGYNR